jgi:hypothetical protein
MTKHTIIFGNCMEMKELHDNYIPKPVLKLISANIVGKITSKSSAREIKEFNSACDFSKGNQEIIEKLFQETKVNNFEVIIEGV